MFIVVAVILFFCFYSTECVAKRLNKVLVRRMKDQMRETEIHSLFSKSLNTQSFENTLKNRDRIMLPFFCFDAKKSSSIDGIRRFSSAKKSSKKFTWTIFGFIE